MLFVYDKEQRKERKGRELKGRKGKEGGTRYGLGIKRNELQYINKEVTRKYDITTRNSQYFVITLNGV